MGSRVDVDLVVQKATVDTCLIMASKQMQLYFGVQAPYVVECVPGKWNVCVPRMKWSQVPETVSDNSLGFLLVHEMVVDDWTTSSPFGIEELKLTYETVQGDCNNFVMSLCDGAISAADSFALDRDRRMARMYETIACCQMALEVAKGKHVHANQRVFGIQVNQMCSQSVKLVLGKLGGLVVMVECEWQLPMTGPIASFAGCTMGAELSDEMIAWLEGPGKSVYDKWDDDYRQVRKRRTSPSARMTSTSNLPTLASPMASPIISMMNTMWHTLLSPRVDSSVTDVPVLDAVPRVKRSRKKDESADDNPFV